MAPQKPWADEPFPLLQTPSATKNTNDHSAHYIANEMAFAHNSMLRGLNALYLQAPNITSSEAADFFFFAASWSNWVLHHHIIEETHMFPAFEAVQGVDSLQHNVHQHHEFSERLTELHKYATSTTPADYDGKELCALIDSFANVLRQHLADEIDTLWAMDSVPAKSPGEEELLAIYNKCEAEAGKQDKNVVPPMVLGLCDKTFQGGNDWPKMPMGSAYFVHYLLARKHSASWTFLPCDTFGRPRDLPFARSR